MKHGKEEPRTRGGESRKKYEYTSGGQAGLQSNVAKYNKTKGRRLQRWSGPKCGSRLQGRRGRAGRQTFRKRQRTKEKTNIINNWEEKKKGGKEGNCKKPTRIHRDLHKEKKVAVKHDVTRRPPVFTEHTGRGGRWSPRIKRVAQWRRIVKGKESSRGHHSGVPRSGKREKARHRGKIRMEKSKQRTIKTWGQINCGRERKSKSHTQCLSESKGDKAEKENQYTQCVLQRQGKRKTFSKLREKKSNRRAPRAVAPLNALADELRANLEREGSAKLKNTRLSGTLTAKTLSFLCGGRKSSKFVYKGVSPGVVENDSEPERTTIG